DRLEEVHRAIRRFHENRSFIRPRRCEKLASGCQRSPSPRSAAVRSMGCLMNVLNLPRPGWMTEDLVLLEDQARRFIATEYVPHLDIWNEQGMYGREVWTKAGAAGLLCPAIPEQYGGAGGSFAHEAVIGRELSLAGFDSFGAPLHSGIVAPYILHYGTDEQKRRWLPKLVTGELVGAIAMSEPGTGSDLQAVRTSAKKSGNGYLLNG